MQGTAKAILLRPRPHPLPRQQPKATSKTRPVRPWDWLPCDWMRPITKEVTSKTHPHYDSLQTTAMASSFLRLPSPMGLMALKHRGKTATLATSPHALPWWCQTVGMGIGRTSRLSCPLPPKVRFLDGVVCVLLCVGLHPCRLLVVLLS